MGAQIVELHFSRPPRFDFSALQKRAEEILGEELDRSDTRNKENTFLLYHKNHPVQHTVGHIPAQTCLLQYDKAVGVEAYAEDIRQSWGFQDCKPVLEKSVHTLLVGEMMAMSLPPRERVRLFHGVLQAAIETTQPDVLAFKHSQQIVQPSAYMTRVNDAPISRPGSLNVRFFAISNSGGDILMDTRGLMEIGLHDLQCHFRKLEPNDVGKLLYETAIYLFENGPVVRSGDTIDGVGDSRWICQFENALVAPKRDVLNLNPGSPYSAGAQ